MESPIHSTVDFQRPGKQHGHLCVPYSYNLAGWANLLIPCTVIGGSPGRTALVMAGNHGDEYPGQVTIMRLLRELEPQEVRGRLILIPAINMPAAKAATRLSPLDGKNLNRAFPGRADGTVTEVIAHYLTTVLFPMADIVVDLHTGGRSMDFYPCADMHLVPDLAQRREMLAGTTAFNTDFSFLYADIAGTGLLPVEAERQGKIVITTEMGGTENVTAAVHRITQRGLRNVLTHFGLLTGRVDRCAIWACRRRAGCKPSIARIIASPRSRAFTKISSTWDATSRPARSSGRSIFSNDRNARRSRSSPPRQAS